MEEKKTIRGMIKGEWNVYFDVIAFCIVVLIILGISIWRATI